jgi:hypothetical protein
MTRSCIARCFKVFSVVGVQKLHKSHFCSEQFDTPANHVDVEAISVFCN